METQYRIVTWTDENHRPIRQMAFHVSDLAAVLDLPFPIGAVCRDPVTELTQIKPDLSFYDGKFPYRDGDQFQEVINQGHRHCYVIAVDDSTGAFLYEYDMPGGRTFLRNHKGSAVQRGKLSRRWLQIIEGEI